MLGLYNIGESGSLFNSSAYFTLFDAQFYHENRGEENKLLKANSSSFSVTEELYPADSSSFHLPEKFMNLTKTLHCAEVMLRIDLETLRLTATTINH